MGLLLHLLESERTLALDFLNGVLPPMFTFTGPAGRTYIDAAGVRKTAGANIPRFDYNPADGTALGLLMEQTRIQYVDSPSDPVTQTITLPTGTFNLQVEGTGSVTAAALTAVGSNFGVASSGSPRVLTITTGGTVTLTITGSLTLMNVINIGYTTSYIGSATTLTGETCDAALGSWYNHAEGTWVVKARAPAGNSGFSRALQVDNNGSRYIAVQRNGSSDLRFMIANNAGSIVANTLNSGWDNGTVASMACGYKTDSAIVSLKGGAVQTDSSVELPTALTTLRLLRSNAANYLNGHLQKVDYFPRLLSQAEIIAWARRYN